MEFSNSSKEGNGYHADDSAMSKETQSFPGDASSSYDASSAQSVKGIAERKVERPGGSQVKVSAEPLSVSSCQSSQPSSSGHRQQGELIESGFQTEKKQECVSHPHMNMYKCSQGSQEDDDEGILWPDKKIDESKQSCDLHSNARNKSQTHSQGVFGGNSGVHSLQASSGTLPVTNQVCSQSEVPQVSTNAAGVKRKHLHMGALDCAEHAQTVQGSMALKNPAAVRTSSKDVNRGLYPRPALPRPSYHQRVAAASPPTGSTGVKRMCSPSKIRLSLEQMKNQSRIHQYFPASPRKTEHSVNQKSAQAGSHPETLASPMSQGTLGKSPIPRKNLNSQFASIDPVSSPQRQFSAASERSQQAGSRGGSPSHRNFQSRTPTKVFRSQTHSSYPADHANTRSPTLHPRQAAEGKNGARDSPKSLSRLPLNSLNQPLLPSSQERTPTKTFNRPKTKQSPSPSKSEKSSDIEDFNNDTSFDGLNFDLTLPKPVSIQLGSSTSFSPAKSVKSTVESDIEDFNNDTSFDGLNFDLTLPKPVSIQLGSSTSFSPAKSVKSTVESDIEDFNNDTSFDGLDFDVAALTPGPSQALSSQVDSSLEAFEKDSFFDNIDPEMLSGNSQSIPSLPSSQTDDNLANTFGLLGEGFNDEEMTASGFTQLPIEILQRIFCFVPLMDLCRNLSCVCKLWNEIISKEEFIPWKKTYYRVRQKVEIDESDQLNLLTKLDKASGSESLFMLDLVRNMPKFQVRFGTSMDRDLQKHTKYGLAKDIMKDRAPELLLCDIPNPWSTVALLVILSETVHDVSDILRCLLHPTATCTTMELLECLYCIASHLWIYKKLFGHNIGWHYRVYYTLYLFENSQSSIFFTPKGSSMDEGTVGPSSIRNPRVLFTHEQCRIINHDIKRGQVVKIQAFAGTGKTTTLGKYAKQRPNMSFLYVAFNKSVQKHAKEIFPRNVTSSTMHSLAFKAIGWRFKEKIVPSFKPFMVHKLISGKNTSKPPRGKMHWMRYAKMVCKTLDSYCASADDELTTRHVPVAYFTYKMTLQGLTCLTEEIDHNVRMDIAGDATKLWKRMMKSSDSDAVITHDVYLKLYQLSKPRNLIKCDCLLIDEAQDLTPAQQDILMNQDCAKILVGDDHQQIYSFRGATNAMSRVVSQHTFHLTQSFRFGPGIAYIADCILERSSQKVRHILVGKMQQDRIDGEEVGQVAIITRTNVTLFKEAVRIVEADTTTMIAFAGGIEGYGMDLILDIHQLQLPKSARGFIKSKLLKFHLTIDSLKAYANQTEEIELLNKIRIVEQYNTRIPDLIKLIWSRTRPESSAAFVLSTVHKSKGLEFDTVKITDDFAISADRQNSLGTIRTDELNMIYVALTRAKKSLVLNSSLLTFLSQPPAKERFMYPVPAKSSGDEEPKVCAECEQTVPQNAVVLLKIKNFKLAYPTIRRQGVEVLCPHCSLECYPSFQGLFNLEDQDHAEETPPDNGD